MKTIQDRNSSGQGRCVNYKEGNDELVDTLRHYEYDYSHSVFIAADSKRKLMHCFKLPGTEHSFSFYDEGARVWQSSVSPASSYSWNGMGVPELKAHLESKARRYNLKTSKP